MATSDEAHYDLSYKELSAIPEEVQLKCSNIRSLNLSGNQGIQLHNSIRQFSQLRKLVLRNCGLSVIPEDIGELTELQELVLGHVFKYGDLKRNDFSRGLTSAIGRLGRLKLLDLQYCNLTTLPESIGELQQLETLKLDGNYFDAGLPTITGRLVGLKQLHLASCKLTTVPQNICELEQLEKLNLKRNNLSGGLPADIGKLRRLKELDLQFCYITTLPESFGNLEQLETLKLDGNYFGYGLPTIIGRLVALKHLHLASCKLTVPQSIGEHEQREALRWLGKNSSDELSADFRILRKPKGIDLRSCNLTTLSESFCNLEQLEKLVLRQNNFLGGLPSDIGKLVRLKELDLSHCWIETLPESIGNLKQLETLKLSGSNFTYGLPADIGNLMRLKELDLGHCRIETLPKSIGNLEELEVLELTTNDFSDGLPAAIWKLMRLKHLNLRQCCIATLPESIGNLKQLETLTLSGNKFTDLLPADIGKLVRLKVLDLSHCRIETLPKSIGNLEELEILMLSRSKFSGGLPPEIGKLVRLKKLDLRYCKLTKLAENIGNLQQLEELVLGGYASKPNDFARGLTAAIGLLGRLKRLDLNGCNLANLPDSIGELQQLEKLDLSRNNFSGGLPASIGNLMTLKKLELSYCHLATLPESIGNLKQLETLNLKENKFQEYPKCTLRMKSLRFLDLSNHVNSRMFPTKLKNVFGMSIKGLRRSRVDDSDDDDDDSDLTDDDNEDDHDNESHAVDNDANSNRSENRFSCWKIFSLCTCCKINITDDETDVRFNDDLTPQAMEYESSQEIAFLWKRNCIKQLPIDLAYTCLHELRLEGNPITEPPQEIWEQGIKAIKSFMHALGAGRVLMHADTLNMIGDTGAGKTSVAQSLVARSPRRTDEADHTQVLHQLQLTTDDILQHSVNINDFGGHEIYHSVIPIFLPANGLVILVFRLNDETAQENVKKWLFTVIAKSKDVRVIIVGTHADQVVRQRWYLEEQMRVWSTSVLQSAMKEVTDHICHLDNRSDDEQVKNKLRCLCQLRDNLRKAEIKVVAVSCLKTEEGQSDGGLSKLFDFVEQSLRSGQNLPLHWCQVMNAIVNHDDFYITMEQVKDICKDHFTDADDSEARATILRYLSKTSQIIWLENHERLGNIVFHSPLKIINICKCILHHDSSTLKELSDNHLNAVKEYENGILPEAMLRMMLCEHLKSETQFVQRHTLFDDVCNFMSAFNLINSAAPDSRGKKFIIPYKLKSPRPTEVLRRLEIEGSTCLNRVVVQLSFFGSIMPMAFFETSLSSMLTVIDDNAVLTAIWRDGLIVHRSGVCFIAERCGAIIKLSAFSGPHDASPWTLLRPVLKRLRDNVNCSWPGAPPHCAIVCPNCVPRIPPKASEPQAGVIKTDLMKLTTVSGRGTVKLTCENCHRAIPNCLCFPPENTDTCTSDQREIEEFFKNYENSSSTSLMQRNFKRMIAAFHDGILIYHVKVIANYMYSTEQLSKSELEMIMAKTDPQDARYALFQCVEARGEPAILSFAEALRSIERRDLAYKLCSCG